MKILIISWLLAIYCIEFNIAISDPNSFLIKYAMSKARETCVGEKLTRIWEKQVRHVVEECRYYGTPPHSDHKGHYEPGHPLPYAPADFGGNVPPLGFIPDHAISLGGNNGIGYGTILVPGIGHSRKKRGAGKLDSANDGKNFIEKLVYGETRIREQISNISCVLVNLRVIGSDWQLLITEMGEATSRLPVDDYLKADLLEGIDQCSKFANCLPPPSRPSSLIPFELKRAYAFIRCSQLKRQMACVKKDIRKNIDKDFPRDVRGSINLDSFVQRMLDVLTAEDVQEYEPLLV